MVRLKINFKQALLLSFFCGLLALFVVTRYYLPDHYEMGTEITVPRNIDKTWNLFTNPKRWKDRISALRSVNEYVPGTRGIGEEIEIAAQLSSSEQLTSKMVITQWNRGRSIEDWHVGDWLNGQSLPIKNVFDRFEFKSLGAGQTRIIFRETYDAKGVFNQWLAYFVVRPAELRLISQLSREFKGSHVSDLKTFSKHG